MRFRFNFLERINKNISFDQPKATSLSSKKTLSVVSYQQEFKNFKRGKTKKESSAAKFLKKI